jgi:large subunit ribosomal protein L17
MVRGRQLSRDTEHRKSLRRNLVQSLFEHGQVRTTLPKAQEVRAMAEKLITLALKSESNPVNARRRVTAILNDRRLVDEEQEFTGQSVVQKLFADIAPKFVGRNGGYTRIIKTARHRIGDGGSIVVLQLVTEDATPRGTVRRSAGLRRKRNEKKHQFAGRVRKGEGSAPAAAESTAPETPAAEPTPPAQQ